MTTYQLDQGVAYVMEFIRGQRFSLFLQWKDSDGAVQDMTTKTSVLTVRNADRGEDDLWLAISSNPSADGTMTHSPTGITINIEPQGTLKVPEGKRSVFNVWLSPDEIPLLDGIVHARRSLSA